MTLALRPARAKLASVGLGLAWLAAAPSAVGGVPAYQKHIGINQRVAVALAAERVEK